MSRAIEYLDTEDLVGLARRLLGEAVPLRDIGLLGAVAARPQASAFGEDAYPGVWTKAAALLQSIVKNRPLVDGNKRLGWLATAVFLELNDTSVAAVANDEVYALVIAVASGTHSVDDIADALQLMLGRAASTGSVRDGRDPPKRASTLPPGRLRDIA